MKNVLVTGAGGFIGSHLTERLVRDGHHVRALVHYNSRNDWGQIELLSEDVRNAIEVVSGDIMDPFMVDNAVRGCDTIFHLCSLIAIPYSYVAPQAYVATNVSGAINVLQAARQHSVEKVVHTSTSECYGTARYAPIDEKHPLQGQSPYSASKISADFIAESFWRSFGVPVATIRPFNTYGPRQSARAVIPTIISQALAGGVVKLGSVHPTRDMNFVADTVDGFIKVAQAEAAIGEVINIGSGREFTIGEIAQKIFDIIGVQPQIVTDDQRKRPEKSEVERLLCDNSKAATLLDWRPATDLDQGLAATIAWLRDNQNRYKPSVYNL
ncbi:MAG: GDP-mannose 4,6-dehydratase [Gammaproteobacteria bacterium]|nr:GDP-mannose 4,6-dehydratase [Gammaproteobacteria bacterium]